MSYTSTRSSSYSSRSYSSYRSTYSKPSYSSGYKSTRSSSSSSSSGYKSTRSTSRTPITRSNIYRTTTPTQRTTIINNYHSDMYGFNSFFHPFGWGYGGGDFWFWMYIFNHDQYTQNQQIVQATNANVNAQPQNSFWADALFLTLIISVVAAFWMLVRWIKRHFRYI